MYISDEYIRMVNTETGEAKAIRPNTPFEMPQGIMKNFDSAIVRDSETRKVMFILNPGQVVDNKPAPKPKLRLKSEKKVEKAEDEEA